MPNSTPLPPIDQTAIGNDNVQVVGSNNVITRVTNFFAGDTQQQRAQRNRGAMLELVKHTWIKGVLEKSLYNDVLIELSMEERPGAVDHPWDVQVRMPDQADQALAPGTSIMQAFDQMNNAMLILGEPGSGKTTTLLELARDCIARAQDDEGRPIPVVFNLSSWEPKKTLDEWLINELRAKYYVAQKLAQSWIVNDDLQLLLDGLDEVKPENRAPCVRAINDFRKGHGLSVPIVVCSRTSDYEALSSKLDFSGAVHLQALTSEQVDEYFQRAGSELTEVHDVLRNDAALQELVKQPLMLSILMLAYQGKAAHEVTGQGLDTIETRRKHLLDTFIQQMLERAARTKSELFTPEKTKRWLGWLAQQIIELNATPYLFENMQSMWLSPKRQRMYRWVAGLMLGLYLGPLIGLLGGALFVLLTISVPSVRNIEFLAGAIGGFLLGFLMGLFRGLFGRQRGALTMIDAVTWEWQNARRIVRGWLILFLIIGLSHYFFGGLRYALSGLFEGLVFGLLMLPVMGLGIKQISETSYPGQRISSSIKASLLVVLLAMFTFGLGYAVFVGLAFGPIAALLNVPITIKLAAARPGWQMLGLPLGLLIGVIGTLRFGVGGIIQHYALRLLISIDDYLPWRLVPFLDYCVDRIFLRRVGGGYIFVHRILMEHFAAMYPAANK